MVGRKFGPYAAQPTTEAPKKPTLNDDVNNKRAHFSAIGEYSQFRTHRRKKDPNPFAPQ